MRCNCQMKYANQIPPMPSGSATFIHVRRTLAAAERRQNHPVHIHQAHQQNQQCHDQQRARPSLDVPEQQQKKRKSKSQNDQQQSDVPPDAFHSAQVPGNFSGKFPPQMIRNCENSK